MLQTADTIGLFQVESRADGDAAALLPACFYDIVVQVAIIRPGPIVGQMVHPYLNRRAGREPVQYPHPSLLPVLARTLGVPLFQELRHRDDCRRLHGRPGRGPPPRDGVQAIRKAHAKARGQLREGMARNGITGEEAEKIITAIMSFARTAFESHAASFALIAYASAYLKAHYPAAFYRAPQQPADGVLSPSTLVKDAQRAASAFIRSTCRCRTGTARWAGRCDPLGLRYGRAADEAGKAMSLAVRGSGPGRDFSRSTISSTARDCGARSSSRSPTSARSTHSGTTAGPRCGRQSRQCGPLENCSKTRRSTRSTRSTQRICFKELDSACFACSAFDVVDKDRSPLKPMTESERIVADYAGWG
jgi:hypothetical protein